MIPQPPTSFDAHQLPFNKLEFGLFAQNCFLYMFGDERESARLDTLLSVAILILLYFIVIQNLFQGRTKKTNNTVTSTSDSHNSSLFMSAIEEIFDIELEKKQQLFD